MPDQRPTARTYVYIPYDRDDFKDTGARPLPNDPDVPVFYQCPGILIDGAPYTGELLTPGNEYQLSARVENAGAFEGQVTVRFYPSEPATGLNPANLLPGAVPFTVPAGVTFTSPTVPFVPPLDVPSHFCLFAEVTAPLDFSDGSGNPNKDRHYAQQNLMFQKVTPNQRLLLRFLAVGAAERNKYSLGIRQLEIRQQGGAPQFTIPPGSLRLIGLQVGGEPQERLEIELDRWQSLPLQAEIIIPGEAISGAVAQLVIEQIPLNHPHGGPTGAIGIVLQFTN